MQMSKRKPKNYNLHYHYTKAIFNNTVTVITTIFSEI